MVDNESDFIRIVRVGPHGAHGLLNVKSKGFGRTSEDDGLTIRHVKTFAEKFSVAEHFNFTMSEVVDNGGAFSFRSVAIDVSGVDTGVTKSVGNGNGVINVDAVTNGRFTVNDFKVMIDNAADNFLFTHFVFEVRINEFAKFSSDIVQVNADCRSEVLEGS